MRKPAFCQTQQRQTQHRQTQHSLSASVFALCLALGGGLASAQAQSLIVQPGAPGEAPKTLTAEEAAQVADTSFTIDDVRFMQDMIPHHQQAVEMAALVEERTNTQEIIDLAGRIDKSQADEIAFMQQWLTDRGQDAPHVGDDHGEHGHHGHHGHETHMSHEMMGMATPEEMATLATLEGSAFDIMFLDLMIPHHRGAIMMVRDLRRKTGSAYDPILNEFTNDIVSDQTAEVMRMNTLRATLSGDPRVGLAPGFRDAGEAISNLNLIAALPKPDGFFDPENPGSFPLTFPDDEDGAAPRYSNRWAQLSFWNTDMAFADDVLIAGNYHGFNAYKLTDDNTPPELVSSVVCPGGQGDVSIVGDLLIVSVQDTRARIDCGTQGITAPVSDERLRGLRIFDISDLTAPVQVGLVQTCRGSHTHSVVSVDEDRIVVYNSGTSSIRDGEELEGCVGDVPGDDRTALFSIDVIEIPLADPSQARITSSPRVFADDETGQIAGLWQGGDHGQNTQYTDITDQCHDITVYPSANIAAGACSGNGIIFDISDPYNPTRIDAVTDPGFAYWHSATFNNDGSTVIFTDEWGGGGQPRCRASDPKTWGADAIYTITDGKLEFQSYFKIPAYQTNEENCVAHNGSVVPVPGRDIFVQAWYQGGMSLIDFTDPADPVEIAFFDRGPLFEDRLVLSGYWSTYWYDGKIYGTGIVRGLDVFTLGTSEFMTENEIAAAGLADMGDVFNPQQQFPVSWPAEPVVAMAYLDQLERGGDLASDVLSAHRAALTAAQTALDAGTTDADLAAQLTTLAGDLDSASDDIAVEKRVLGLGETLTAIADRLG